MRTPEEVAAELEELRAERDRRRDEKIKAGAKPVVEFVDEGLSPRELGPDEVLILRVHTGVPRGSVEEGAPAEGEPKAAVQEPPARWDLRRGEWKSESPPPPPRPAPRFDGPVGPRRIKVQTEAPHGDNMGAVEYFLYEIDRTGRLTVMDRSRGLIGHVTVEPGADIESYDAVARRVVTKSRAQSDFWRTLN